ncbi:adhesin [Caballeronia novacaledonica]|uniref:adhesin n=1 Tax=Caballeronia novacaledonica TaxID=1544861 RepID=UPI001EE24F8E|nr:adhesin [Caballeronia novacaledonica]GJH11147.1 adhesin [Caballeronia novacaledonica]
MKKAFKAVVFALVAYLVADRAMLHAQGRDIGAASCAQSAAQVEFDALSKGFSQGAASSQRDAFRSQCLVSGHAQPGEAMAMR